MSSVEVVQHNSLWKKQFEIIAERIKNDLNENCIEVYHIGSTAVPNLSAKPIIDVVVVVRNLFKITKICDHETHGEMGIPFRRYFSFENIHVHVFEQGNPEIDLHLRFRDHMRQNLKDLKAYENLKLELAKKYSSDRKSYTRGKNNFIRMILRKIGIRGMMLRYVFHDEELQIYENLQGNINSHYKFVLYDGVKIVGAASVNKDLKITQVKVVSKFYLNSLESLLKKWSDKRNDCVRTHI